MTSSTPSSHPPRPLSRRTFVAAAGTAIAASAVAADIFGRPTAASAAVTWGYPFASLSSRSRGFIPNVHAGIDFTPGEGTPIYAVADGTIIISGITGTANAYGESIWIQHADGYRSIYGHMLEGTRVPVGPVRRGDYLGRVGNTGKSTGPHLHLEIRLNDAPINPDPFMNGAPLATTTPSGPARASNGPTAVIDTTNRISLYAIRTDGNLWGASQASAGAGLSPWVKLGGDLGILSGRPSVLWLNGNILAIYARTTLGTIVGTNQTSVGGPFTPWTTIGAGGNGIVGDPVVVQFDNGAIGVYAATDSGTIAGVAQTSAGASFGSWTPIGTSSIRLLGKPALAKYSDGRIALFARTESSQIFGTAQTSVGSTFAAWADLGTGGAGISTDPAVINDSDRLTVFAGAGSTVSSVSHDVPNGAFGAWVNLGSGPVSVGSATPSVLQTGSTYSIYSLGGDGTVWGSTVNAVPTPAGWGQIGSGATLMTALASIRTTAGLNAIYGTSPAGAIVGSGQSTPGGAFGPWAAM